MLPVPIDWAVEFQPPAKYYQHCFPQVLRYMNSVTNTEAEMMAFFNGSRPNTTDQWETAHFQSMTGEWEDERGIIKACGFNSVFVAEDIAEFNGGQEFPTTFGYFDEGNSIYNKPLNFIDSLEYFWRYVDHTRARIPKNRMYLSWMDSTTHTPLILPPKWEAENYRAYLDKGEDNGQWRLREHLPVDTWLNAVRWTDDKIKEIILGFRERGLEDETLFLM